MKESIPYISSIVKKRGLVIIIIAIIFYVLLASYSDVEQFLASIHNVNIALLPLILLCFSASIILRSIRQKLLLKYIGINMRFKENLILYASGLVMTITPASLGQVIKSHYLLKYHNQPISKTLPIVLVERYHDVLALLSFIIIFVAINRIDILVLPAFVIGIALIGIAIILFYKQILLLPFQRLLGKITIFKSILGEESNNSYQLNSSLSRLFRRKSVCYIWLVSMCAWFFEAIGIFLSFEALQLDLNFGLTTAVGFSSILFGAISFIPGGLGITELSFIKILSSYGLDISASTAVILLIRLTSTWYSTVIGIIATKFISKKK